MSLKEKDKKYIWHPFDQMKGAEIIPIVRGEGAYVFDEDGFHMVVFPHIAAINAFQLQTATGKLKALITPVIPIGCHCSYIL